MIKAPYGSFRTALALFIPFIFNLSADNCKHFSNGFTKPIHIFSYVLIQQADRTQYLGHLLTLRTLLVLNAF